MHILRRARRTSSSKASSLGTLSKRKSENEKQSTLWFRNRVSLRILFTTDFAVYALGLTFFLTAGRALFIDQETKRVFVCMDYRSDGSQRVQEKIRI
jgi:hypothetical protein